jgi:DNA modification methylase
MTIETSHDLIRGDARNARSIADETVDLIVTSPPYPMIEMWDGVFRELDPEIHAEAGAPSRTFEAMHRVLDAVWRECARVLRPGGIACINIGDATRTLPVGPTDRRFRLFTNHARVITAFEALGFDALPAILWWKPTNAPNKFMGSGMLPGGAYVTLEHEYILVLRKGDRRRYQRAQDAQRRRQSAYFWEERNRWFSDIWDLRGVRQALPAPKERGRSGAFPFELAFRLISMYSLYGDTVLDPFLGTGTSTAAAIAAGRNSIGIEIDPHFIQVSLESLERKPELLRNRQIRRLRDHREFAASREAEGKPLSHANTPHEVPVMTSQERELEVLAVDEVYRDAESHGEEERYRLRARHSRVVDGGGGAAS